MTEKSKKLIRSGLSWITFLVIVVFLPRPHNNPIRSDGDALAALFFVLLLLSAGGSARLASDPVYGQRKSARFADVLLTLSLAGAGYSIVTWGVQGGHGAPYALWCVPLLIVVAFNLGRRRGQQDNDVRVSESPHEIWAR